MSKFPDDFIWGAAAASYQIEGAAYKNKGGLSDWDILCRTTGRISNNDTGDVACDHFNRYSADVELMQEIGLKAYRLSVSWPRILPEGTGKADKRGLGFYDKLVDSLLKVNIEPWITLFHWDYPWHLNSKGGWLNRDSSDWFAEYTSILVDALSDRVSNWITLNEPQCFIGLGLHQGTHAPGLKLGLKDCLTAAHNSLLAHGKAVRLIRERAKQNPAIGAAPVGVVGLPYSDSVGDIGAARDFTFSIREKGFWNNTWFSDPMILGSYPEDGMTLFADDMPNINQQDMGTINQPLDFYGANIYSGILMGPAENGIVPQKSYPPGFPITSMGWQVRPESLFWGPKFLYERYNLPIIITENGMANNDWLHLDGKVHDSQRIDFTHRYLSEYKKAVLSGIDCRGYFLWSIMDNFEWTHGYDKRFGLIYVDYQSGKRILKDSAYWYRHIIETNGSQL